MQIIYQQPEYDKIINSEVFLQYRDLVQPSKALQRSVGSNGTLVDQYNNDPGLNFIIYDIEFPNITVKEYSDNVITENMLRQVNDDGFIMMMIQEIINHKMDITAVLKCDRHGVTRRGCKKLRKITCD